MKTLLFSTAILTAMAMGANAQDTAPDMSPVDEGATDTVAPDTQEDGSDWDAGYVNAEDSDLTAERLSGASVYGPNGEAVGEVSEIVIGSDEEAVESVVVDAGGFLGIGEKPVELPLEDIDILRSDDGEELRIGIPMTKDELETMPEYTD